MTLLSLSVQCLLVSVFGLTSEDGTELGPASDPPLRGILAQCDLQEEHRQATPEQEDEVRDEKCTCRETQHQRIKASLLS